MEFTEFEKKLLTYLKDNNDKECIDLIENNKKLIQAYLQDSQDSGYSKELINNINTVILVDLKQYKLVEKVLKHEDFSNILEKFRESDIIINACKTENIDALKWLLTMNINPGVQDENGMTALMHAAEHQTLLFIVDYYISMKENNKFIQIVDSNGETALFHAINSLDIFLKVLNDSGLDVNQRNNDNETVFIKCCKNDKPEIASKLILNPECDLSCIDNQGRTGLMYLVENGRCIPLNLLPKSKQCKKIDLNYRNQNNETLLSILVKQFYETWQEREGKGKKEKLENLVATFRALLNLNCDFNSAIDEEGNTIMNFFLMIDDLPSAYYLLIKYDDLDLSIKNNNGINASFLTLFMIENEMTKFINLKKSLMFHKTFDCLYLDPNNNNLLIHYLVRENSNYFFRYSCDISKNTKILNQCNNRKENVLIVAVKSGHFDYINEALLDKLELNQQDELGNTALHYAIKLRDDYAINSLCYYHADKDLKNNQGKSSMDLVMEIKDHEEKNDNDKENESENDIDDYNRILNILKNPIPPEKMKKSSSKSSSVKSFFSFKKKTTDEKVNNYIKTYLLEQYKREYEDLLIRPYSPYTSILDRTVMKWDLYFTYDGYGNMYFEDKYIGQRNYIM